MQCEEKRHARRTIYCYGDSNTWGYDSRSFLGERFPEDVRWTGILQKRSGCRVINDGVNGRRIPDSDMPVDFLAGHLAEELRFGKPLSLWILLGTNDLLSSPAAREACAYTARRMDAFLGRLFARPVLQEESPDVRLIAPAPLGRGAFVETDELVKQSRLLGMAYAEIAGRYGAAFTDMSQADIPLLYDGVHYSERGHQLFAETMLLLL